MTITEVFLKEAVTYQAGRGLNTTARVLRARDGWVFEERGHGLRASTGSVVVFFPYASISTWIEGPNPLPVPVEAPSVIKHVGKKAPK